MDLELDPASDCNCMKSYKTLMCLEAVYNYLPVRANNNALLLHCRKLLDTAARPYTNRAVKRHRRDYDDDTVMIGFLSAFCFSLLLGNKPAPWMNKTSLVFFLSNFPSAYPGCRCMSVIHGCPSSVIRPSLLLLPVLGTVCPNMSRPHALYLFSEVASRLSSSKRSFPWLLRYRNL